MNHLPRARAALAIGFIVFFWLFIFVTPAAAHHWQFGPQNLGPGYDDADCVFYRGQAACSGWGYWNLNQWARVVAAGSPSFQYLCGYENSSLIRGVWVYNSTIYISVAPVDLGMGGYLKAHLTYWSGTVSNELSWAYS